MKGLTGGLQVPRGHLYGQIAVPELLLRQVVFQNSKINYVRPKNYNEPGILAVKFVAIMLEIARGRPADSIARPTSLTRIYTITVEGLNIYGTP